jgi:hypothetical protein
MKRPMTTIMSKAYELAIKHSLTFKIGRAAYVANRAHNGGMTRYGGVYLTIMESMKSKTAKRWQEHWLNGGSLKALRYSAVEWNHLRHKRKREMVTS